MAKLQRKQAGKAGGYLIGRRHSAGGIPAVNADSGVPLELETDEVVITRRAVLSPRKHRFDSREMTNLEILSAINQEGGGVALYEQGGTIAPECHVCCSGREYEFDDDLLADRQIVRQLNAEGLTEEQSYQRQLAALEAALAFCSGDLRRAVRQQIEILQLHYKSNLYG